MAPAIYITVVAIAALVVSLMFSETAGRVFRGAAASAKNVRSPSIGADVAAKA